MFFSFLANMTRGAIAPEARGRQDTEVYSTSLSEIVNFTVMKQGGLRRRSGTIFFGAQHNEEHPVSWLDFVFSSDQAYALEAGQNYLRVWKDTGVVIKNGVPYVVSSPFTAAQAKKVQWAQINDVMYLASGTLRPKVLQRFAEDDWRFADFAFLDGPYLPINDVDNPVTLSAAPYPGTTVTVEHASTANVNGGAGFLSTDVGRHYRVQYAGKWAWGTISTVVSTTSVTLLVRDGGHTDKAAAFSWTRATGYTNTVIQAGTQMYLTSATNPTTLRATDVGKSGLFNIEGAEYWCDIKDYEDTNKIYVTIGFRPSTGLTTTSWRLGAWSDTTGWPSTVEVYDGRLCWAATSNNPRGVAGSRSNLPTVYSPSAWDGTVVDSNGFFFDAIAGRADPILWIKDAPRLQLGTASSIRTLGPTNANDGVLSPRNVSARTEANTGTIAVPPIKIGPSTVHAGRFGTSLSDGFYSNDYNSLVTPKLSLLSEHFFDGRVARIAYAQEPESAIWIVTEDGKFISVTLERDEKILGFAEHNVGGVVEDILCIPSQTLRRDVVFMTVRRTIAGLTRRYIEILDRPFVRLPRSEAYFVDCGIKYVGPPVNLVSGLNHLEGQTVDIIADGSAVPSQQVVGGRVSLPNNMTASRVHVGLKIVAYFDTLRARVPSSEGANIGRKKKIAHVYLDLLDTLGVKVGPKRGRAEDAKFRDPLTPMGQSPGLFTGTVMVPIEDSFAWDAQIRVRCDQPYPCTVLGINQGIEAN